MKFFVFIFIILTSIQSNVKADAWSGALQGLGDGLVEIGRRQIELDRQKELIRYQYELERQRIEQLERIRLEEERQFRLAEEQRINLKKQRDERIKQEDDANSITTGSGFFISNDGYFVTNYHVVQNARSVTLMTIDGNTIQARIIQTDIENDLALLKAEVKTFALPIASSGTAKRGQFVATIGYPHADIQGIEPKVTEGIISSLSGISGNSKVFQISVPIQSGNSGGPLVTKEGNVIGVIVSKLSADVMMRETGDVTQNVNYAIKSNYLIKLINSLNLKPLSLSGKSSKNLEEITEIVEKATALVVSRPKENLNSQIHSSINNYSEEKIKSNKTSVQTDDAVELFEKVRQEAMQGEMYAQENIGYMYAHGTGTAQNNVQAISWFRKAAAQGSEISKNWLRRNNVSEIAE